MNRNLLIILLLFNLASCTDRSEEIKATVNKWNELHNNPDPIAFQQLYAPEVLFYGQMSSGKACYEQKERFFTSAFRLEIVSPISIQYFSSGTIKCDFTKRTTTAKKSREHLSYLLLKKIDGNYLVTGESDVLTDQRRNVKLEIGSAVMPPGTKTSILISIILVSFGGLLTFRFYRKRQLDKTAQEIDLYNSLYSSLPNNLENAYGDSNQAKLITEEVTGVIRKEFENYKNLEIKEENKGVEFEKYIATKFDRQYFKLKEWRGDKYHEGIYAETSHKPDMEWELAHPLARSSTFAVECKYRSKFDKNDGVELGKDYQIKNYKEYESKTRIPVFIILGIDGSPFQPNHIYIIPLRSITSNYLNRHWLDKFRKRKTDGTFFYDWKKRELS